MFVVQLRFARALLLALPLLVPLACNRSEAGEQVVVEQEPTRSLPTTAVIERDMPRELVLTGTLLADRQSDLAANASGRVLSTHVERGQTVAAGDVLARLDARLAKFSAKAAAAQTKVAKAQLDLAALECDRAGKLLESGTISKAEYDRTMSTCATSQSSVSAAQSNAALASVQAGDSVVKAPFRGIVGERFVEVGEYVQPATRVLSLYAIDPIRVSIAVPELDVARVAMGQRVSFTTHAVQGRSFDAEVRYMSPALRDTTRDLVVEAVAPNPDAALRPGMFATVHIGVGDEPRLVVPESAIVQRQNRSLVFALRGGRAIEQVVRLGTRRDGVVAVLSGLTAEDSVVTEPPADLADGTKLE